MPPQTFQQTPSLVGGEDIFRHHPLVGKQAQETHLGNPAERENLIPAFLEPCCRSVVVHVPENG